MKKTLIELMNDSEKVLVNRGDMFMLLHTATQFFYQNKMSEKWVCDTLGRLCERNRFPKSFHENYGDFLEAMMEDAEKNSDLYDSLEKAMQNGAGSPDEPMPDGFESIEDLIDFLTGNDGPES